PRRRLGLGLRVVVALRCLAARGELLAAFGRPASRCCGDRGPKPCARWHLSRSGLVAKKRFCPRVGACCFPFPATARTVSSNPARTAVGVASRRASTSASTPRLVRPPAARSDHAGGAQPNETIPRGKAPWAFRALCLLTHRDPERAFPLRCATPTTARRWEPCAPGRTGPAEASTPDRSTASN